MQQHMQMHQMRHMWRRGGDQRPVREVTLNEELPRDIAQSVAAAGIEPEISVAADISAAGDLHRRWLVADRQRLMVIAPNGHEPTVELDLRLADLSAIRVDSLVGCQALTAEVGADDQEIVRYSVAEAPRFAKVRAHLDAWCKGEEPRSTGPELKPRYCPKCRQPLPRDTSVCPRCVDRGRALSRMSTYLKPHVGACVVVALTVVVGSALQLLLPQLGGLLYDRVFTTGSRGGHEAGSWIRWMITATTPAGVLRQIVLVMLIFQIFSTALATFRGRLSSKLAYQVVHDIRSDMFTHVQALSLRFFDRRQTGTVLSRITQDTRAIQGFLIDGVENLLDSVIKLSLIAVLLFSQNWQLAVLTVLPAPLVVFLSTAFWRRIRVYYSRLWHSFERLTAALQDSLGGVRVVKAFTGEEREIARFNADSKYVADAGTVANQLRVTIMPWLFWSIQLSTLVVYLFGGGQVLKGEMSPGEILQFLGYLSMFYGPMGWISNLFNWFNETLGAAERVWEVMDEQPDVPEATQPLPLESMRGAFTFDHVTFGYEPHEPVLHDVCIDIAPGEMIGLVGHSGAGKSTLINLICRFYDVDEGRILIDGYDLREVSVHDYRARIGVVLQEPFLFNGSIHENVAYGRPGASFEEVLAASKAANAHDFITNFADGYDTIVGERGMRLSGGERQRISIARAILHDPQILILDEATASVDTETERQIQEALQRLVQGRTVFAIAHRLSTLRHADRLVVIEKGRVVETGTHDELMANEDGNYHKLVNMQQELSRITHIGG